MSRARTNWAALALAAGLLGLPSVVAAVAMLRPMS